MTIDEIYRLVQVFANKEQRGFITPSDFNLLAKQAELELFNKRLKVLQESSNLKRNAGLYQESLTPEVAEQDLTPFLVMGSSSNSRPTNFNVGGLKENSFEIPNSVLYIKEVFILPDEELNIDSNIPLEIVKPEDVNKVLRSSLVKPSIEFPIGLIQRSSSGKSRIKVFPDEIRNIVYYYYNISEFPRWEYVTVAGKPVYNPSNSIQSNFNPRVHGEVVIKVLEYLGINLREADLVNYSSSKEIKEDK